jgi:hypothetical protein
MRALRVLAGAGVSVVLAAGCTGGSGAAPSASTSASASVSTLPSPSVTPSATASVPAAARAHTKAGAEAFVRFYMDQVNLAWTTPDDTLLAGLYDPGCKSCSGLDEVAHDLAAKGRHYASRPVALQRADGYAGAPAGQQLVHVQVVQNAVDILDSSGSKVSSDQRKDLTWDALLSWEGVTWRILDMG